ncbi:helix-turn-helix domain-containing protein [Subtercola sp. PAMC28395]|uniref:ArsR/SmtB family transcription factor n=1 Tax=Subtercola sp. PAMC28395 TaxID=2846775 RepID=UPI001C0AB3DB|nr:winged helix-turn-helix domain-containing protein [Subtercola sp. PAMC28395]QWT25165.1 helix-turn-helix domain-containing protein [Subtercola sp. PAMC28395]
MSHRALQLKIDRQSEDAARAFQAIPARIAILATLNVDGPQTRGQLAERLGLGTSALQHQLVALREIGLVVAVPLEEPDHYHRSVYRIEAQRLESAYNALGLALGVAGVAR